MLHKAHNLLSGDITNEYISCYSLHKGIDNVPAEELDLDPVSQHKSPVPHRVEGRL